MMTPQTTPVRLDLKRDEKLTVEWQDGRVCVYPITLLRTMCPCAACKNVRSATSEPEPAKKKTSLTVLPGNFASGPITVLSAELVGNYALKLEWSDQHSTGIYSFQYLREICPNA